MATVYNVEAAKVDILITQGDNFDMTFEVEQNDEDFDMTDGKIDIDIRYLNGTIYRAMSSEDVSPEITILSNTFTILSSAIDAGLYKYDVQYTEDDIVKTIQYGKIICKEDVTEIEEE